MPFAASPMPAEKEARHPQSVLRRSMTGPDCSGQLRVRNGLQAMPVSISQLPADRAVQPWHTVYAFGTILQGYCNFAQGRDDLPDTSSIASPVPADKEVRPRHSVPGDRIKSPNC